MRPEGGLSWLWLAVLLQAPGDRLFATKPLALLSAPRLGAATIRQLKPGDELAEQDPPTDELTGPGLPKGWCVVQTVDVPSGRSFGGYVQRKDVSEEPLPVARRIAVVRQALEDALAGLEAREKPFADLRGEIEAWRARLGRDSAAPKQVQELSDRLASYMMTEVSPRAMDAQDDLAELRDLGDERTAALSRRFDKAARVFRP